MSAVCVLTLFGLSICITRRDGWLPCDTGHAATFNLDAFSSNKAPASFIHMPSFN